MIEGYRPHWMTEELASMRDLARRFVAERVTPNQERWMEASVTDRAVWRQAGELGILLPDIAAEHGGSGGTFAHEALIAHELCLAGDASFRPGKQIHVIAAHYLARYGTPEQKQRWLPGMASGEVIAGLAMTEPDGGTDLQSMKTRAIARSGGDYVLDGSKTFITNGSIADLLVVAVKTNPAERSKGVSLLLLDTKTAGFRVGRRLKKIGLHGSDTCELFFDGCIVPAACVLGGEPGQGFYQMMRDLTYERALAGVNCAAVIEHAFAVTRAYTRERILFGKPLLEQQNTRFLLAEVKTIALLARLFADYTIDRMVEGTMSTELSSMSKWWISEQQCDVVNRCLQLFGGHGYMLDYPIARMFVDGRVEPIYAGSNEILKDLIGRSP